MLHLNLLVGTSERSAIAGGSRRHWLLACRLLGSAVVILGLGNGLAAAQLFDPFPNNQPPQAEQPPDPSVPTAAENDPAAEPQAESAEENGGFVPADEPTPADSLGEDAGKEVPETSPPASPAGSRRVREPGLIRAVDPLDLNDGSSVDSDEQNGAPSGAAETNPNAAPPTALTESPDASAEAPSVAELAPSTLDEESAAVAAEPLTATHDDVRPSSFEGVTPGVTTELDLTERLGEPKSRRRQESTVTLEYAVGPFPKTEFIVVNQRVDSIVVQLPELSTIESLRDELSLNAFAPAVVPGPQGEVIGTAFPERGVVFVHATTEAEPRVNQIILEPISAESFLYRAKFDAQHRFARNLKDLNFAIQKNPKLAEAYSLRARILDRLHDPATAVADIDRAIQLEPNQPRHRVTRARLLVAAGRYDEAVQETQGVIAAKNASELDRAAARVALGDAIALGATHDYKRAIGFHTAAIEEANRVLRPEEGVDVAPTDARAAQTILLFAHWSGAHDVACGQWRNKSQVMAAWLQSAETIAGGLAEAGESDDYFLFLSDCRSLATYDAAGEGRDVTETAQRAIERARSLQAQFTDPLYQQALSLDLAEALIHAAQVLHRHADKSAAMQLAQNAHVLLDVQTGLLERSPRLTYLQGKLWFLLGVNHAVFNEDHTEAVEWYERALTRLQDAPPGDFSHEFGLLGERFVSMGVSYWGIGRKDRAIELTRRGTGIMQKAVAAQALNESALEVPYSNLANMYRQMGNASKAKAFNDALQKLKQQSSPANERTAVRPQ